MAAKVGEKLRRYFRRAGVHLSCAIIVVGPEIGGGRIPFDP
jgi:hypothetical protein